MRPFSLVCEIKYSTAWEMLFLYLPWVVVEPSQSSAMPARPVMGMR